MSEKINLPIGSDDIPTPTPVVNDNVQAGNEEQTRIDAEAQVIADAKAELVAQNSGKTAEEIEAEKVEAEKIEAERITNEQNVTEVEIGDSVYALDADGNAVDGEGVIKFTSEEMTSMEEDTSVTDEFELTELSQIQPYDVEGNAIQYTNTPESRRQYIEDVYQAGALDRAEQIIQERYNQNPLLKTVSDYIVANGNLDGFSETSFNRIPITDDSDENALIATIQNERRMKGDTEVQIANMISWAKSDGKLKEVAQMSDEYLAQNERIEQERLSNEAYAIEEQRADDAQAYISSLQDKIQNGQINIGDDVLNIPTILEVHNENGNVSVANRNDLLKYATQINQYKMADGSIQNATQYQIDKFVKSQNKGIDDDIFEMVNLFTGNNNSQILKSAINTDKSQTIRKRLKMKTSVNRQIDMSGGKLKIKLKYN